MSMLTLFTTPKPFVGQVAVSQRNALQSWELLHPGVKLILFGNEEGAAAVCRELGIRQVPDVRRYGCGTKYLTSIFDRAQEIAVHDVLCYVNCDILLMSDFRRAVESISQLPKKFLLAGCRWRVDAQVPLDFHRAGWEDAVRHLAVQTNRQRPPQWIDYFVFSKGLYYRKIPEFVIGRPGWDNWLIWFALPVRARRRPVQGRLRRPPESRLFLSPKRRTWGLARRRGARELAPPGQLPEAPHPRERHLFPAVGPTPRESFPMAGLAKPPSSRTVLRRLVLPAEIEASPASSAWLETRNLGPGVLAALARTTPVNKSMVRPDDSQELLALDYAPRLRVRKQL